MQGGVLVVRIPSASDLKEGHFSLISAQGAVIAFSRGFHLRTTEMFLVLLGISPTAAPGAYLLKGMFSVKGKEAYSWESKVHIKKRTASEKKITISREVTRLVRSPDPQKKEEAERLRSVLRHADPQKRIWAREPFHFPIAQPRVTSSYGERRIFLYSDGIETVSVHKGVDFGASKGTPILAPARGKVALAEKRILTGWTVLLEHYPSVYSVYYHMDSLAVGEGAIVKRGEILGVVGSTGFATGSHLHWEIRVGTIPADPFFFMGTSLLDKESSDSDRMVNQVVKQRG